MNDVANTASKDLNDVASANEKTALNSKPKSKTPLLRTDSKRSRAEDEKKMVGELDEVEEEDFVDGSQGSWGQALDKTKTQTMPVLAMYHRNQS